MRDWVSLRVAAPAGLADAVANFLLERGVGGLVTEDGAAGTVALEAALPAGDVAALRSAFDRWLASLATLDRDAERVHVVVAPTVDVDWVAVARRHHRAVAVGRRLLVAPPWDVPASTEREVLVIEPGMAFGTGQHATTRACLEAIESALAAAPVRSALDVGTGSGVLAMALARLGVPRVVALDVDPAVLPLARANLLANRAPDVALLAGPVTAVRGCFDLVLANLLADAVVAEARRLAGAVAPAGRLVLSGLTAAQLPSVTAAYRGWTVVETRAEDEWRTLTLARGPGVGAA
ncbi:MAG TPA: 50S ribosomal protein L11 methyltransferase [Candidatus Binatia bacterium]|nr:50S ribosomal protein L11 methyltransferase [Candidatus Binatia bacterium]